MSTLPVFPSLPGITWPAKRSPVFSNSVQVGLSGQRTPIRFQIYPRWNYELVVEFLRSGAGRAEFSSLVQLFLSCNGSYGTFLFSDPDDYSAAAQSIGVGDGVTTQFPLVRSYCGFVERVAAVNGPIVVTVAGTLVPSSGYTISPAGVITFTQPPAAGAAIVWSGMYYWVCRFADDTLDLSKWMNNYWEIKSLKFTTEIIG